MLFVPEALEAWAAQHGLGPSLVAWMAIGFTLGYNKTQLARALGVSRKTIHKYCRPIRVIPPDEWLAYVRDLLLFNPGACRQGRLHR